MTPAGMTTITMVGAGKNSGRFTVPAHIAQQIRPDALFRAEWHPEGILFRLVMLSPADEDVPEWAKP